jgi:hypothetical protein
MYPPADPWDAPIDPTPALPTVPAPTVPPPTMPVPTVPLSSSGPQPSTLPLPTAPLPPTMYGRATVPGPVREPTAEMPTVPPPDRRVVPDRPSREARPVRGVSYEKAGRASRRSLFDGWGFSAVGLLVAFCGWGIWAAAGRGTLASPTSGLVIMLTVALGLFMLSRFLGYVFVERLLRRQRLHARWSHAFTGIFLVVAGLSYLKNTTWLIDIVDWMRAHWQQV